MDGESMRQKQDIDASKKVSMRRPMLGKDELWIQNLTRVRISCVYVCVCVEGRGGYVVRFCFIDVNKRRKGS
jgi:hypothetical protein